MVRSLKAIQKKFKSFDRKRIGGAGKDLEQQIDDAVRMWESNHGPAN
jgi:hypothetical protein